MDCSGRLKYPATGFGVFVEWMLTWYLCVLLHRVLGIVDSRRVQVKPGQGQQCQVSHCLSPCY